MVISSTYICPARGLDGLLPPEPNRLRRAAGVAKGLGIERLHIPILEESIIGPARSKIAFLDGLIKALDQVAATGMAAWLAAPAQRILGLDWVAPHLVRAVQDPRARSVYVEGKVRNLWPLNWWADPHIVQTRIRLFRELVSAVSGHGALTGWLIMDRALEWPRPEPDSADVMLRSCVAEIRERDETCTLFLGLGCHEFVDPHLARMLARQVDGVRLGGLDNLPSDIKRPGDAFQEFRLAAYLGTMLRWLFETRVEIELGWSTLSNGTDRDPEATVEGCRLLSRRGPEGVAWLSLADPDARLYEHPPWVLRPDLRHVGLLDTHLEPKDYVEMWLSEMRLTGPEDRNDSFIDISVEEYLARPESHFYRLWDHFRECCQN